MERIVNLHIEKLPEGLYLATSLDFSISTELDDGRVDVARSI
ncbi:MAG TPA: hypothetical protein VN666_04520 [Nitrospira sp.]|nr:hypothetical protein [Nitrospira sp.]